MKQTNETNIHVRKQFAVKAARKLNVYWDLLNAVVLFVLRILTVPWKVWLS